MTAASDLAGAAVIGGAVLALVLVAEIWARVGQPKPEWTRKLVHTGGGLACVLFPFLIRSPLVVLLMAASLSAIFALGARGGWLRSLHRVARPSHGAEYYPLAIFLMFLLTKGQPWLYVSTVLVLAVADALAALVGSEYGAIRFEVEEESKSVEGSIAFFTATFLAVHLPLLLMTDLPRPNSVLAATLVALVLTGLEIICLRGTDNLFVPLAGYMMLSRITTKPLGEIVFQNLSLLALSATLLALMARTRAFGTGGAITFVLFTYAAWSLGSVAWAVPPLFGFAGYALWCRTRCEPVGPHKVRQLTRVLLPPLVLIMVANATGAYRFFYGPFLAACATLLALAVRPPTIAPAVAMAGGAWALVVGATWPLHHGAFAGLAVSAGAVIVPSAVHPVSGDKASLWGARRFLLTVASALIVILAQIMGLAPSWTGVE